MIDSPLHLRNDENLSVLESSKRSLIQPSIDFLETQLHDAEKHVHHDKNRAH
jgi:hypothetical protein